MICTMLNFVKSVSLDIWHNEQYVCFWPLWFSKPTVSLTVITFFPVRVCFGLPVSRRWSMLRVSKISLNNISTLFLLQSILKNSASILQKLYFTRESSYCFQRVLAIAIVCPSVRPSVCLFVTRVDQSKTVQDRITKSSPSAARRF